MGLTANLNGNNILPNLNAVWNPVTLSWDLMRQPVLEIATSNVNVNLEAIETLLSQFMFDVTSSSQVVIDSAHHEIHDGDMFFAHHNATGKNDGQTINIYFKTPNTTKQQHMLMDWSASGQAYARILEAPTVTANTGTNGQVCLNRNRKSSTTSVVLDNATSPVVGMYGIDVTVTGNGTEIWEDFSGSGKSMGGVGREKNEIILAANTAYVFQVEADAAGLVLNLALFWYEHTP